MIVHFLVRFEPRPGYEEAFRNEMQRVIEATRGEAGCVSIRWFEFLHAPVLFFIHSEWVDEAAFDLHIQMPHTMRFVKAAEELLTHEIAGHRTKEIATPVVP